MKKIAKEIQSLCWQIVENFNQQKIILFGSHAYGKPNADSDVDFLVIMPFGVKCFIEKYKRLERVRLRLLQRQWRKKNYQNF